MDRFLFLFLTNKAGYSIPEMAQLLQLSIRSLDSRLDRQTDFTLSEMTTWAEYVDCQNPGAVFFPQFPPNRMVDRLSGV